MRQVHEKLVLHKKNSRRCLRNRSLKDKSFVKIVKATGKKNATEADSTKNDEIQQKIKVEKES